MSDVAWMLGGGVSHDAEVPRWATAALAGDLGGVCGVGHLAVSQDDTPGMRLKVAAGYVLVKGGSADEQGVFAWYYPGGTVDIAPGDPSNPRDDVVGVQIDDDPFDASGENRARVVVTDGTPASSPSDPVLPPSFTPLARVRVAQNESTSIVAGDLTDMRVPAGRFAAEEELTAALGAAEPFAPTWGNLTVGNGTVIAHRMKVGGLWHVWITLEFGTTTSVTGVVSVSGLPTALAAAGETKFTGAAQYVDAGSNNGIPGNVEKQPGNSLAVLRSSSSSNGSMTATTPFTWGTGDRLHLYVAYPALA